MILQAKNINYSYEQGKPVLTNVNLDFEKGKIYAIVGKSGSGKTTLLSLLSGLDKIQDGDILFDGKGIKEYNLDDFRAQKIGIIFQQYNLLNNYSVLDNILIAMRISGNTPSEEKAIELIEKVGLTKDMLEKNPLALSGGQQQRVAIARTLAKNCDVIIADEPTGNLDEETEQGILNLLKTIVEEEGKTLIMVTHSNYISQNAEHVYGITNGNINVIK